MTATTPTLHITLGPGYVYTTETSEPRWCFGERKRLAGTWTLMGDVPMGQPSWYEPNWVYKCDGCGEDRRAFGEGGW